MRKVVLLEHVSLDGYVAGPQGEMDWVHLDDELWDLVTALTDAADTAIYGRLTYEMMAGYWPTAAEAPTATQHDIDHATWLNGATRVMVSRSQTSARWGTDGSAVVVGQNLRDEIEAMKQQPGKDLLLIGSISVAQAFMNLGLIDEFFLSINPVVLGGGRSLFEGVERRLDLKLANATTLPSGVVAARYEAAR
jgi:dihydrofolate reductase